MNQTEFNHLLSRIKALPPEQLRELRQQLDKQLARPKKPASAKTAETKKPLTEAEFQQHLLNIGLISSLPDPALDIDDDDPADQPVPIKGRRTGK
jgi:hypothetical protein